MKRVYEAPVLIKIGPFRKATGRIAHRGNDRLILSKN